MIPTRQYTSGSEVLAGYAAVRKRLFSPRIAPRAREEPEQQVRIVYSRVKRQWVHQFDEHVKDWREHLNLCKERPEAFLKRRCGELGVSYRDVIKSSIRFREHAEPRQVLMAEVRERYGLSYPTIGKLFGGRDHTTAVHACRKNGIEAGGRHLVADHHDEVLRLYDDGQSDIAIGAALGFSYVAIWSYRKKQGWTR